MYKEINNDGFGCLIASIRLSGLFLDWVREGERERAKSIYRQHKFETTAKRNCSSVFWGSSPGETFGIRLTRKIRRCLLLLPFVCCVRVPDQTSYFTAFMDFDTTFFRCQSRRLSGRGGVGWRWQTICLKLTFFTHARCFPVEWLNLWVRLTFLTTEGNFKFPFHAYIQQPNNGVQVNGRRIATYFECWIRRSILFL